MTRTLVTGGAGFIGSHLLEYLATRGHAITVVDDLSTGLREHVPPSCRLVVADLRSDPIDGLLQKDRPDVVVHLAAQSNVRRSIEAPIDDARTNVIGSLRLLDACARQGVRRIVFASSGGAIYGEQNRLPIPEDAAARPRSPYGVAKLAVEHYLTTYAVGAGFRAVALRFGNVYGPRQRPEGEAGVVAIFARQMLRREPITFFGDGSQSRDYVYVSDAVQAAARAIDRLLEDRQMPEVINVGTGLATSVAGVAETLEAVLGVRSVKRYAPAIPGELTRNALDPRRASVELDWQPRVQLQEGVTRAASWFLQQWGGGEPRT